MTKTPSTVAVTKGDSHHRSVRKVRAEIAARPDCVRPGWAALGGGDGDVVVMTSIQVGGTGPADRLSGNALSGPAARTAMIDGRPSLPNGSKIW